MNLEKKPDQSKQFSHKHAKVFLDRKLGLVFRFPRRIYNYESVDKPFHLRRVSGLITPFDSDIRSQKKQKNSSEWPRAFAVSGRFLNISLLCLRKDLLVYLKFFALNS